MRYFLVFLLFGCAPDTEPYNHLSELRVLAIQAEPADMLPAGSTTLQALVYPSTAPLQYQWSWCVLSEGSQAGYECALSFEDLTALLAAEGLSINAASYDLGTQAQPVFNAPLSVEAIQALCSYLTSQDIPEFANVTDCSRGLKILVRLQLQSGDATITAVKDLNLLTDANTLNLNPIVSNFSIEGAQPLTRASEYNLTVEIPTSTSELTSDGTFENLVSTWFVESGETRALRSSYVPDNSNLTLENASKMEWTTPTTAEFLPSTTSLYVVVRDNRGGVNWQTQQVTFAP